MKNVFSILFTLLLLSSCSNSPLEVIGKAPDFSFTNQNNQKVDNSTYKGKVYVVEFFFTTCPTICPIMTSNMVKVQNAFIGKEVGFASFSINPEYDTPEILKEYAHTHGITSPHWHLQAMKRRFTIWLIMVLTFTPKTRRRAKMALNIQGFLPLSTKTEILFHERMPMVIR